MPEQKPVLSMVATVGFNNNKSFLYNDVLLVSFPVQFFSKSSFIQDFDILGLCGAGENLMLSPE